MNWKRPLYWMDRMLGAFILILGLHALLAGFGLFEPRPPTPFFFAAVCWFAYRQLWEHSPYGDQQ